MARVFMCGYETGSIDEDGGSFIQSVGEQTLLTSGARTGTYAVRTRPTNEGTGSHGYRSIALASNYTDVYFRIGLRIDHHAGNTGSITFWRDFDTASGLQIELLHNPYNTISAYRGGTGLATSAVLFTCNVWHLLRIRHLVHDSTGVFQVYLDDDASPIIDFSGDTCNTANVNVARFAIGAISFSYRYYENSCYVYWDDLAVNDASGTYENALPNKGGIIYLKPTGAGNYTQLTPSTGSNYACVDEVPPSTADYVYSDTEDKRDTYTLEDVPAIYNTVYLVQPIAYAALSAAGTGGIRTTVRSGATDDDDDATISLSTTYAFARGDVRYRDPADSAAWTPAKVNALESGVVVK